MSQSKHMLLVLGLAFSLTYNTTAKCEIVRESMQNGIACDNTKEEEKEIVNFVSIHQEGAKGEIVENTKEDAVEKDYIEIRCELTFYTSLASCCGDSDCLTASGVEVNPLTLAVPRKDNSKKPVFPFGTKVVIDGYGEKIVQDTGNPKYLKIKEDGTYIFDVYVPREQSESDEQYRQRVLEMGRVESKAKVYLQE